MSDILERMVEYWQWADSSVWNLVTSLSDKEFTHRFGNDGPSIHQRYLHLAEDSWEWYADWTGADIEEEPDFDAMSREDLFTFISDYNRKWAALLESDQNKTVNVGTSDNMVTITLPEIVFHMNNHATYHRGQIIMALRMLGKEVQFTDYVPFRLRRR
ncbi:MAG: DinB family protein [Candidatus Thorarchaeota archaeon]